MLTVAKKQSFFFSHKLKNMFYNLFLGVFISLNVKNQDILIFHLIKSLKNVFFVSILSCYLLEKITLKNSINLFHYFAD